MEPRLTMRERHLRGIVLAAAPPPAVPKDDLALPDLEEIARRIIASDAGSPLPVSELAKMRPSRGTRIALAARETWRAMIPFLFKHSGLRSGDWIREARWNWFATLTVAGPEPSSAEYEKRVQRWLTGVARDANNHVVAAYVVARGRFRHRVHAHVLISFLDDDAPDETLAQRRAAREVGRIELDTFKAGGGACEYIANHFTGDDDDAAVMGPTEFARAADVAVNDDDARCVVWVACPRHRICRRRSCLAAQCAFPLGPKLI